MFGCASLAANRGEPPNSAPKLGCFAAVITVPIALNLIVPEATSSSRLGDFR